MLKAQCVRVSKEKSVHNKINAYLPQSVGAVSVSVSVSDDRYSARHRNN